MIKLLFEYHIILIMSFMASRTLQWILLICSYYRIQLEEDVVEP